MTIYEKKRQRRLQRLRKRTYTTEGYIQSSILINPHTYKLNTFDYIVGRAKIHRLFIYPLLHNATDKLLETTDTVAESELVTT